MCAAFGAGLSAEAQAPRKRPAVKKPSAATTASAEPKAVPEETGSDKARFDEAIAATTPAAKAELLVKFLADFPKSELRTRAQESLAVARAALADEALAAGNPREAAKLFRVAIDQAPKPYSERLFHEIILTIPANLFWRGARAEGYEIAHAIEANVSTNAKQLAALGNFYLNVEDGTEAKRIAEAAIKVDGAAAAGYQTLGMAHRLNFELEESERAFAKAVELDPNSNVAKRMLAEMRRALGRSDEAVTLYQEILAKDENDNAARTGLVLALFDAGKRAEAEAELVTAMERTPGNVILLAGAAYWYAVNNDGVKGAELAGQAIAKEPRYIWSHIALARGLMAQGKPVEAEQTLIAARKYGNFPTLRYEIASARFAAGFYRDAAEELRNSFAVDADGVRSKLGGRIDRSAKNFTELVSYERRASIFAPAGADTTETAEQMRALLEFEQAMSAEKPNEDTALAAAERFAGGSDEMATYRRLYAARALNEKQVAPERALEYARSAITRVDTALNVSNPASAVMASELYEPRATAFSRNDFLLVPDVPRQTLSAILRGRIEESTGVALLQSGNAAEASVRFRRALSVLPKDSAWWRSATWNLGRSLEAEGKDQEALRAYITSYKTDRPNVGRYLTINTLYKKVNGSADGLEAEVGPSPLDNTLARKPAAEPESKPAATTAAPVAEPVAEKPVPVKRLPSRLPVADPNAPPIQTKVAETKAAETAIPENKAPAEITVETKSADLKHEEAKPVEEKPVEVKRSDETTAETKSIAPETKPVSDPAAETKPVEKPAEEKKDAIVEAVPEPKAVEDKPGEVKLVEEKPAEVKPAEDKPVEEKLDDLRPAEVKSVEAKPVEEKKQEQSAPPPEEKLVEVKKDPAPGTVDKPVDAPKPVIDAPKPLPEDPKPEEKKEIPADPPAEAAKVKKPAVAGYTVYVNERPYTERSANAAETSRPQTPEPKPNASVPEPEGAKPVESNANMRPRLVPGVKPEEVVPPARTTAKNGRPANTNSSRPARDPSRPLFEPIVIKVPAGGGDQAPKNEKAIEEASATAAPEPTVNDRVSSPYGVKRCNVSVSQENVTIRGADGTVALLVSLEEGVDITSLRGASGSDEIQVVREPRIAGIDDRIVYLLRSATGRPGLYQVAFTAPCGRKIVNVRVR